jgi:hypothetical protein
MKMKKLARAIPVLCTALLLGGCLDSKEVEMVKGGTLQMCPGRTVEQMVNGFMGSPSWKSDKTDGGQKFVNVEGDITYQDAPVRALLQFTIEGDQFQFQAFEMNGVPSPNIVAAGLMQKMCAAAT